MSRTTREDKEHEATETDRNRYLWLLDQCRSAPIASDGTMIFDLRLALPPAKSVEESIDLARHSFSPGDAITPCRIWLNKKKTKSKYVVTACEPVTMEGCEALKLGLHLESGHHFRWHVTEFSTGVSLTNHCPSREAAMEKARGLLNKYGPKQLYEMLESLRA